MTRHRTLLRQAWSSGPDPRRTRFRRRRRASRGASRGHGGFAGSWGLRGVSLWGTWGQPLFFVLGTWGQPWGDLGSALFFGGTWGQPFGDLGSAFVFCFRSRRYPPDGNKRAIGVSGASRGQPLFFVFGRAGIHRTETNARSKSCSRTSGGRTHGRDFWPLNADDSLIARCAKKMGNGESRGAPRSITEPTLTRTATDRRSWP